MSENCVDVSVIIPTYNHAGFLEDCLSSVFQQAKVSYEIIIVDDGSTDHTADVLKRHGSTINYIYKDNAGLSAARNTGLKASSGRYIQFLDADDLLAEDCLFQKCRMMDALGESNVLVCRSRLFSDIKSSGKIVKKGFWRVYTSELNTHLCRLNIAPPHAYFSTRSMAEKIGGFDESYKGCEDYDYWLKALGLGYDFHYCAHAEVLYRKHGNSMGNAKARAGIYPFDVLVHRKKHSGKYGPGMSAQLESPGGMLALADGVLRTALMIDPAANPEGQQELVDIACTHIRRATKIILSDQKKLTLEATLYVKRISQVRPMVRGLGSEELIELIDQLNKSHSSLWNALRNINMMFPVTTYERQALMSASIKNVIGSVFARG